MPIRVIVTTGPVAPESLRVPANVELHRYIPHDEVMPSISLVIGHGGHSTTVRALAHGIPLLILPMHSALDQAMVGEAVAKAGAARVLPKTSSPGEIRSAVRSLLEDSSYRHAAGAVGARLRSNNGAIAAADELETLLRVRNDSRQPAA
jgi:UDP:flavonoid glycosyltransferase YjiC (YdhE family)